MISPGYLKFITTRAKQVSFVPTINDVNLFLHGIESMVLNPVWNDTPVIEQITKIYVPFVLVRTKAM